MKNIISSDDHHDSIISSSVTSLLEKRGSTFATNTHHTPIFNTVHIIAAVIGIIGAIAVIVTVIFFCRRKRKNQQLNTVNQVKADIENNMIQHQHHRRFGQFASDFDNTTVEPPKPTANIVHVEDVSPMMQQYQLQLKLLQQQQEERQNKSSSQQLLEVPSLHHHSRANSSSSSSSTSPINNPLLPPPPYHP